MNRHITKTRWVRLTLLFVGLTLLFAAIPQATAQSVVNAAPSATAQSAAAATEPTKPETHITAKQAKKLFKTVDELLKFASSETGLPITREVKRRLTNRAEIDAYLKKKFEDDEDAKRMQHGEIVLKKFGLLDHDFALKPFLMALLTEQIAGYYDSKTHTVNMLDWLDAESQKPVLAHELTHALQDQYTDLEKWNNQTPSEVSYNAHDDTDHIARDEMDTAREAVLEGQAMAVFVDYSLKPQGLSLIKNPGVADVLKQNMNSDADSPVMARAPLMLSESMLFPYREGLSFEEEIWVDKGQAAAFAGAIDRPPTSSWEIYNPREYEKKHQPSVLLLPDIHPLVDKLYKPYDIGQIGELDLRILTELSGNEEASSELTNAWDGGLYWVGQRNNATVAEQGTTASIALFYLSAWKNTATAAGFARLYADQLGHKYSNVKRDDAASTDTVDVYATNEGPVTITTRGKLVFITESFDLALASQLSELILDAQGTGELQTASTHQPAMDMSTRAEPLTAGFVRFFANCGVMKAAVNATHSKLLAAQN